MSPRRTFFLDGGVVLMYALAILVILATIGLSLQETGASLLRVSQDTQYRRLAQHAADSGVRYGLAYIRSVVDPSQQYPGFDTDSAPITHTSTPAGMGGNYPPIHPCNIFFRLLPQTDGGGDPWPEDWIFGRGKVRSPQDLGIVPIDPANPDDEAQQRMRTSFTVSIRAINIRTNGIDSVGPGGMPGEPAYRPGEITTVGLRYQELVDQVNQQFCHACTEPEATAATASDPSTPPSGYSTAAGTLPWKDFPGFRPSHPCWCMTTPAINYESWEDVPGIDPFGNPITDSVGRVGPVSSFGTHGIDLNGDPATFATTITSSCTFLGTQPYMLTSTGTVTLVIQDTGGGFTDSVAVAQATATQVITISCRLTDPTSPPESTHATYIVTAIMQERPAMFGP